MRRLAPLAFVVFALGCSSSSDDSDNTGGPSQDTGGGAGSGGSSATSAGGHSGGSAGKASGGSAGHAGTGGAGHANGGASGASGAGGSHAGKGGAAGSGGTAGSGAHAGSGAAGKAGAPNGGNGGTPGQGGANPAGGQTQSAGGIGGDTGTSGSGGDTGTAGSGGDTGTAGSGGDTGTAGSGGDTGTGGSAGSTSAGGQGGVAQGSVTFDIDLSKGPARQYQAPATPTAVSPYVYGINGFAAWNNTTKWGMARQGGDAFTDWNWTINASNSAADYCFWQGQEDGGANLAGAITNAGYSIPTAQSHGVAYLATVPIVDFVSSSLTNNTGINGLCPGTPGCGNGNGYAVNSGKLDFASTDAKSKAFVKNAATKPSAFCTCSPTGACPSGCKVTTTGTVYQDEFANYLEVTYGSGGAPIFLSLDNEPNFWPGTHPEVWPFTGTPGCGTDGTVTFDDIVTRNSTYASAIKKASPSTKVFGPVVAQDGIIYAHSYSDPHLPMTFTDYYLGKMAAASETAGKALLDAYDIHYYTVGSGDDCLQTPRMFWDPSFTDFSASKTDGLDFGYSGANDFFDKSLYPRQMIPRLLGKISAAYGATKTAAPGLSISEYNAGCELQIEGGVAQADMLGIFGREGVFAASAWPLQAVLDGNMKLKNYLVSAYDLYRNYDGKGAVVGDLTVEAKTSDVGNTSVYAFAHTGDAAAVDVVAINKTNAATTVTINIASGPALSTAAIYQLVNSQIAVVAGTNAPTISCAAGSCSFDYTMPPKSATTLILR